MLEVEWPNVDFLGTFSDFFGCSSTAETVVISLKYGSNRQQKCPRTSPNSFWPRSYSSPKLGELDVPKSFWHIMCLGESGPNLVRPAPPGRENDELPPRLRASRKSWFYAYWLQFIISQWLGGVGVWILNPFRIPDTIFVFSFFFRPIIRISSPIIYWFELRSQVKISKMMKHNEK